MRTKTKAQKASSAVDSATTVVRQELLAELSWVARFCLERGTIPICGTVLFKKRGTALQLTATDLDIAGETFIASSPSRDFALAVPVKRLIKYLDMIPDTFVIIGVEQYTFTLKHAGGELQIEGLSADSFPAMPKPHYKGTISGLMSAAPRILTAISKEESRFTLNGALLEIGEVHSKMVSTDGHRLSVADITSDSIAPCRKFIPRAVMVELVHMGLDCYEFGFDADHLFVRPAGDVQRHTLSRIMTGNFPDYENVISKMVNTSSFDTSVNVVREAVQRTALFAGNPPALVHEINADKLEISSRATENGSAKAKIKLPNDWAAQSFRSGFNANYILDFLSCCGEKTFTLAFSSGDKVTEWSVPGWRYLLMPMKI
jgi:DNA polymerase-3 subunit beta